jgi:hypothetical protein
LEARNQFAMVLRLALWALLGAFGIAQAQNDSAANLPAITKGMVPADGTTWVCSVKNAIDLKTKTLIAT